jgi:hypothetical protein
MYCGGSNLARCPCCGRGWHDHGDACKYRDAATARLNARTRTAKEK